MPKEMTLFETDPLTPARFLDRPNRFILRYREGRRVGRAYLANPGRMGEILLPETTVLLARRPHTRTGLEAVGATWSRRWRGDRPRSVFLNTGSINHLARRLLEERLLPELAQHEIVRREFPLGGSRIDFLLRRGHRPYLLEVKSVTLVEQGLALFPDAQTTRGRRHLLELARRPPNHDAGVLFIVQGWADRFLPDFHNDLAFARTFREVGRELDLLAYRLAPVLAGDGRLRFRGDPQRLDIPRELLEAGVSDGGVYCLLLRIPRRRVIEVGALGRRVFAPGWYVYAGSARRALSRRLDRHLRRRKKLHYHVDYLRAAAATVTALPIRAAPVGECDLARELRKMAAAGVEGFGCSDCACRSHLFHFPADVLSTARFQQFLTRLRHRPVVSDFETAR